MKTGRLRFHRRRRSHCLRSGLRGLNRGSGEWARLRMALLVLLLELRGNARHWRYGGLDILLRSLAEAGELWLKLSGSLRCLQAWVSGVLLLKRHLTKSRRLGHKLARLLLLMLLLLLLTSPKRTAILLLTGREIIAP